MNAFAISRLGTVLGRETLVREVDGWILRLVGQAGGPVQVSPGTEPASQTRPCASYPRSHREPPALTPRRVHFFFFNSIF